MEMGKALSLALAQSRKGLQDQFLFPLAVGLTLPMARPRWPCPSDTLADGGAFARRPKRNRKTRALQFASAVLAIEGQPTAAKIANV